MTVVIPMSEQSIVAAATPAERAKRLFDMLPDRVRIGAHDFAIVKFDAFGDGGSRFGSIDFLSGVLRMSAHASPTNLVDTFLHEALHGLWRNTGQKNPAEEETLVSGLAPGLVALFRDNPWLTGWIAEAVK